MWYIQKIIPAIQAFISVYNNELSDTNVSDKRLYLTWYESTGEKNSRISASFSQAVAKYRVSHLLPNDLTAVTSKAQTGMGS